MNESKPWWQSKTLWINGLYLVASTLTFLLDQPLIKENPQVVAYLGTGMAVLNMILRMVTSKAVTAGKD